MDPNQMPPQIDPSQGMPQMPGMPPMPSGGEAPMVPQMPSGGEMPMGVPAPTGGQPVSEEQKQELLDLIQGIREKLGSFNAQSFAGNNKLDRTRRELLRQVFEVLQKSGIDLTNRESVAAFIEKLREQSPELADQFEEAISALLGETDFAPPSDPNASMDLGTTLPSDQNNNENINPNEAIPQNI